MTSDYSKSSSSLYPILQKFHEMICEIIFSKSLFRIFLIFYSQGLIQELNLNNGRRPLSLPSIARQAKMQRGMSQWVRGEALNNLCSPLYNLCSPLYWPEMHHLSCLMSLVFKNVFCLFLQELLLL